MPEAMKFAEDMQDIPKQIPPLLEVHSSSSNGTVENGIRKSRPSDPTNNSSSKATPEVIDLDEEDSPKKQDTLPTLNGVNTTVKKVSWPWPISNMGGAEKIPSESSAEVPSTLSPDKENAVLKEVPLTPADTTDSKAVVGERKRPNLGGPEDCDAKRPKTDTSSSVCSTKGAVKEGKVDRKTEPDTKGSSVVSVVDLVEDDDEMEQEASATDTELKSTSKSESVKGAQTAANEGSTAKSRNDSKLSVTPVEKSPSSSPVVPMVTTRALVNVHSSSTSTQSNPSDEKKTKSLSSSLSPTTNGLIQQLPAIEVKKVKLCPQLEKQATAMSAVTSLTVTPAVATPKLASGASLVQTPVSMTASVPETTEIPSLVSSKSPESAKEVVKEEDAVTGSELESKKGLNPIHSETRKRIQKLTRAQLEHFFLEMACELILTKSDAGKYRQLYEEMKESADSKAVKISQLHKQVTDLSSVVHKAVNESKERNITIPTKTTRSVGLQLDPSNITHAYRVKSRDEKFHTNAQPKSTSSQQPPERSQPAKIVRPSAASNAKSSHPTPNGLITNANARDTQAGLPSPAKSPQRQLRALHPRIPQSSVPGPAPAPSSIPAQSNPDPSRKMAGFIDIADDSKIMNNVGVRRHRGSVLLPNSTAASVTLSPAPNSLNSTGATTVKVISPKPTQAASITSSGYAQPGAQTRLVTATTIPVPAGTPVTTSRLTYIIPSSTSSVQQRQLLLASTGPQPHQARARPALNAPMQAVIMRPGAALVQVQAGAITSTPTTLMRTIPSASAQSMIAASRNSPQQQAARLLVAERSIPNRPPPPARIAVQHPAPLPAQPQPTVVNSNLKPIPRRPVLKLSKVANGIVLSWNMTLTTPHEEIASYQLYAYQEGANAPPSPSLWKKVGDVKALPLPMACTLTQFADGHTYHFAVRAVDVHGRVGEFSMPGTIELFN